MLHTVKLNLVLFVHLVGCPLLRCRCWCVHAANTAVTDSVSVCIAQVLCSAWAESTPYVTEHMMLAAYGD